MSLLVSRAASEDRKGLLLKLNCEPDPGKASKLNVRVEVICTDGRTISQAPNGPVEITHPGEDKITYIDPETGGVLKTKGENWVATPQPDGTTRIEYTSGMVKVSNPENGSVVETSADGKTRTIYYPKECKTEQEKAMPDGSVVRKYADKTTNYIVIPGLIPTTYYVDGRVSFGNGEPALIDRSNTVQKGIKTRTPYGDGSFFVEYKHGKREIEIHNPDGTTMAEEFMDLGFCAAE